MFDVGAATEQMPIRPRTTWLSVGLGAPNDEALYSSQCYCGREVSSPMKLPGGDQAVIDDDKLIGYCLNPEHPEGRHKARVFQSVLGIGLKQALDLKEALHQAAAKESAEHVGATPHGDLYTMDFMPHHEGKAALVRSVWMVRKSESVPRLVSCYVHKSALRGNA